MQYVKISSAGTWLWCYHIWIHLTCNYKQDQKS